MQYTVEQVSKAIGVAYAAPKASTAKVQEATTEHASAQQELTEARQAIIRKHADDPKALGSNEAARNARIEELVVIERQQAHDAAEALRDARDQQELDRLDVEHWRAQLRAFESGVADRRNTIDAVARAA